MRSMAYNGLLWLRALRLYSTQRTSQGTRQNIWNCLLEPLILAGLPTPSVFSQYKNGLVITNPSLQERVRESVCVAGKVGQNFCIFQGFERWRCLLTPKELSHGHLPQRFTARRTVRRVFPGWTSGQADGGESSGIAKSWRHIWKHRMPYLYIWVRFHSSHASIHRYIPFVSLSNYGVAYVQTRPALYLNL